MFMFEKIKESNGTAKNLMETFKNLMAGYIPFKNDRYRDRINKQYSDTVNRKVNGVFKEISNIIKSDDYDECEKEEHIANWNTIHQGSYEFDLQEAYRMGETDMLIDYIICFALILSGIRISKIIAKNLKK